MKIFLDDKRLPKQKYTDYKNWVRVTNVNDFLGLIDSLIKENKWIDYVSFDYDTNKHHISLFCFDYLIKRCILKDKKMPIINIHSDDLSSKGVFISIGNRYETITRNKVEINQV